MNHLFTFKLYNPYAAGNGEIEVRVEVTMKVYAIFANDNIKGTSYKLFSHAVESLRKDGHDVDVLNLYEREKEIPFFRHDRRHMESNPFYEENKQRFMRADLLLIVFPLFWYSVPAILKAWLDMINGWAYKYEQGLHAQPLHHIKKALVVYSSMQDSKHINEVLHSPVENQLSETCNFIGIPEIEHYLVDSVNNMTDDIMAQHKKAIEKMCATCIV